MDIVLGVSMLPAAVRMLLVEGENAGGVTVDADGFDASNPPERVVAAILGTRESAAAGGYRLTSTGVTFGDEAQASVLRDALARYRIENVVLVSGFLAAAALTQAVGNATRYAQTALLFVEPGAATLAVVDSDDGSIADVRRRVLSDDDEVALAAVSRLAADAGRLSARPDGLLVVGSGVNVPMIKPALQAATALPVSVPAEPDMALAHGAALAAAHAPLLVSSTRPVAWSQDPGTGAVGQDVGRLGSVLFALRTAVAEPGQRLLVGSLSLFVIGVVALAFSLAIDIRPTVDQRPGPGGHVVIRTEPAAAPKAPAPQAPQQPAPAVQPVPAKPPPAAPPVPAGPPALPAPPPVPLPPPPPVPLPPLPAPPVPGVPGVPGIPGPGIPGIPGPHIPGPHLPGIPGIPGIPGL